MTHARALLFMFMATAMWSTGGVVTRLMHHAKGFELTMWRSVFAALTILVLWPVIHREQRLIDSLRSGKAVWISGLCWATMFTCFMMALSLTSVANVLVAQSIGPVLTALVSWLWLRRQLESRTWAMVIAAGVGMALMFILDAKALTGQHLLGFVVALCIPTASAINWNLVEKTGNQVDFIAAVFIGAVLSALITLPLAFPLRADWHDIGWLAFLGVVQLGIPCALCVLAAKHLPAPELSLLTLLEVIFGIALTTWLTSEPLGLATVIGGSIVIFALVINEVVAMNKAKQSA